MDPYDFHKSPPPSAPPAYGQPPPAYRQPPATGIPVSPSNYNNYADHHQSALPLPAHGGLPGQWSTGLCDCCSDCSNCCVTCLCPCITFGQIAEIVDKGSTSCVASGALYALVCLGTGCGCMYSCFYRSRMRRQYMLPENPCTDCLVHFCCESCSLCQEHRELKNRGFDMAIGWNGNVEKQNPAMTMPPIYQGAMSR